MPTRPLPARWLRTDVFTAVALAAVGAALAWLATVAGVSVFSTPLWLQMLGSLAVALPLVWRRRRPLVSGLVQSVAYSVASLASGMDVYASQVSLFLGFYSMGAWSSDRGRSVAARGAVVVVMALSLVVGTLKAPEEASAQAVDVSVFLAWLAINSTINLAYFTAAWIFGDKDWQRAVEKVELQAANERIVALQAELIDEAVEQERLRVARELHDVVAHHVTAMSVQAAAARRLLDRDVDAAAEALKSVESSARSAVQDLRRLVLTLRSADEPAGHLPMLDDVPALIQRAVDGGQRVTYEVVDEPHGLTPAAQLTLYRVVQEGLTNAAKHAGRTANVAVRLRTRPNGVELEISDDGHGLSSSTPGSGTGLQGMRERVAAVGGTVEAGPKPRGGYRVRVELPTVAPA